MAASRTTFPPFTVDYLDHFLAQGLFHGKIGLKIGCLARKMAIFLCFCLKFEYFCLRLNYNLPEIKLFSLEIWPFLM